MKWILASTTALALTMGVAQISMADDPVVPATDYNTQNQENGTVDSLPVTPEAMDSAAPSTPAAAPDATAAMDGAIVPLDATLSAREVVGADVIGPDGKSIGVVDDLVLDTSGQITQVIIADGAVLGFGGKKIAISYSGATVARGTNGADPVVHINMTEESLATAAEFDKSRLEQQGDRLASSYLGRDVELAASDDAKGEISDLRMDQTGMAKYAIIEFVGVLGMGDSEVAVAFDKLTGAPEGEPMQLEVTQAELEASPTIDEMAPAAGN